MNSDDIILRVETYAPLVTKGSELTANEVDLNFVNIYKDLENKAEATGVGAYDGGTTYQLSQAVTYNGRTWLYVNAVPADGIQPGTDPLYWVEIDPTILVHRRNSDTKLAEFTADEVDVSDVRALLDNPATGVNVYNSSGTLTTDRVVNTGVRLFAISDVAVTPDPSALLELNSQNRGFLPPRMAGSDAENITLAASANGLMVYVTAGDGAVINSAGWWGYDGADWKKFTVV